MSIVTASAPPVALPVNPDGISPKLKVRPQWVGWTYEHREHGWTKPPLSPVTGKYAASTDPATWSSFSDALRFVRSNHLPGIGCVFTREDPYVGVDLDHCRNPETGEIDPWAQQIIDRFDSYAEISPSATGVRIVIATATGLLSGGERGQRKGQIEVYGDGRYFTLTGHCVNGANEIADRTAELAAFCAELKPASTRKAPGSRVGFTSRSDDEIIERAHSAANGPKFMRLWAGDTSEYGGDDSAADQALVSLLAFWTQDPAQLDRLVRRSGLYREKWERADYRQRTIERALERGEVYDPGTLRASSGNGAGPQTNGGDRSHEASVGFVSGVQSRTHALVDWPAMALLPTPTPAAPTMPAALLPGPLRPWVVDIADRNKLPIEMVAAPAVVAATAPVGRAVGLRPGQYDEFTVVASLWGALITRPGWLKTGAVKDAFRPLNRLAAEAREAHEQEEEANAITRERIEAEIKAIKVAMETAARKGGDLSACETALREKRAELRAAVKAERRFLTHDATVEKLGELLRDNPRGMLLLRDELSGWLRSLDKPGREGDREFYLEAWNSTGSYTVDRIGRGTTHIPSLTLSLFGGIQPGKLGPLLSSAVEGGVGDDGLMQRLQVTVYPDRLPPWSKPTRWPEAAAREQADAVFDALAAMDAVTANATDADIPFLRYSPSAQIVADDWRDALEYRLRSDELDDAPAFAAHLAKYRSLAPTLALVFYLIDVAARAPGITKGAVGEAHIRLAADWCGFLEAHARKLYAVELHAGTSAAHALVAKIAAGAIFDGQSVRDLYRPQWAGLRVPERVLLGLSELTDLGWVRVEFALTGGRPTQIVRLHPELVARKRDR